MKNKSLKRDGTKRVLGLVAVGLLSIILSSSAWALDLDQSIQQQSADAAQVMQTLGRGQRPNQHTSRKTKKKVYVMLMKAHPHKKA